MSFLCATFAIILAGCGTAGPPFSPAYGIKVRPLPHSAYCPQPVPKALGYIYTPVQVVPMAGGNWLVADGGAFNRFGSKVVEFNSAGKPIWAYVNPTLDFVHSAYPTTRGNILIADTNNNRVIEVTPQCKIVFNTDDLGPGHGFLGRGRFNDGKRLEYPNDAKELPNGHYLISSRETSTVFEIDRHGHVFWSCHSFRNLLGKKDHLSGQHNPQRLANGDTLISDSNNARVLIVNRDCSREVWQYPQIGQTRNAHGGEKIVWPRDATMMTNHDILVDDSLHNRCVEVNRRHIIVRKYYDLPQPYSCWPMPNGAVASGNSNTHGIVLWGPGIPQAEPMAIIPPKPIIPSGAPPPKHLVNGGFETPAAPGNNPIGWQMDDLTEESLPPTVRAHMLFDASVAHGGFSSALVEWERKTPHAPLFWGQTIRVHQFRWIKVSGWILTNNVRLCAGCNFGMGTDPGNSAYLAVQLIRPGPWQNPTTSSFPKIRGTTSTWRHVSQTFYIPQGVKYMVIQCVLAGKGKAWFDDVHIQTLARREKPGFDSGSK